MQPILPMGKGAGDLPPDAPKGLMLTGDLLFSSRVTGTAAALGSRVDVASRLEPALAGADAAEYRYVILDLGLNDLVVREAVDALRAAGCEAPVIAFGSHVQTERIQEAVDAGCAEVLPRSRFTQELPSLLRECLA